jgi:hypothetical protein
MVDNPALAEFKYGICVSRRGRSAGSLRALPYGREMVSGSAEAVEAEDTGCVALVLRCVIRTPLERKAKYGRDAEGTYAFGRAE